MEFASLFKFVAPSKERLSVRRWTEQNLDTCAIDTSLDLRLKQSCSLVVVQVSRTRLENAIGRAALAVESIISIPFESLANSMLFKVVDWFSSCVGHWRPKLLPKPMSPAIHGVMAKSCFTECTFNFYVDQTKPLQKNCVNVWVPRKLSENFQQQQNRVVIHPAQETNTIKSTFLFASRLSRSLTQILEYYHSVSGVWHGWKKQDSLTSSDSGVVRSIWMHVVKGQ